jgi:hypothetical protein
MESEVRLIGHVDRIEPGRLAGWAADADDPARVVEITILLDGREHARIRADHFRSDLRALKTLGTGEHAFDATWLPDPGARSRQEIRVVFSESKALVPNGFAFVDTGIRRFGRPRYILHIGPHKTGTKYLQTILREQHDILQTLGIRYPGHWQTEDDPSHSTFVRRVAVMDKRLQTQLLEHESESARVIVLSSEEFVDLDDKSVAFLATLLHGADVEIVFYCRRWSQLLYSGWMETIKHGDDQTLPEYVAAHASNPFGSTVVNYALTLDRFAANFGRDRIRLISYTNLVESKADLFRHFAKSLLDWPDAPADDRNINPHLSLQENELLRALNGLHKQQAQNTAPSIYPRYLEYQDQLDLSSLFATMQKDVAQLKLNEAVPGFSTVHEMLIRKYGDRILPPSSGSAIFDPQMQRLSFVRDTWLLSSRSVNMLNKIYKHLTQTRARAPVLA